MHLYSEYKTAGQALAAARRAYDQYLTHHPRTHMTEQQHLQAGALATDWEQAAAR